MTRGGGGGSPGSRPEGKTNASPLHRLSRPGSPRTVALYLLLSLLPFPVLNVKAAWMDLDTPRLPRSCPRRCSCSGWAERPVPSDSVHRRLLRLSLSLPHSPLVPTLRPGAHRRSWAGGAREELPPPTISPGSPWMWHLGSGCRERRPRTAHSGSLLRDAAAPRGPVRPVCPAESRFPHRQALSLLVPLRRLF